jgi:hypothetical protein
MGDGWVAGPELTFEEAVELARYYPERRLAHGLEPGVAAIRRDIHVGSGARDAARVADPVIASGYRGFDPQVLVVWEPSEVAEQFAVLYEAGFTHILVRHLADEQREVLASFERLAEVRRLLGLN